jgi:DNA helicase HerA-like ATPase
MPGEYGDPGRTGVYGRSGSGKSFYVKHLLKLRRRLVIFDPLDEYTTGRHPMRGVERFTSVEKIRKRLLSDPVAFRVAYVPKAGKESARLSSLAGAVAAVQAAYLADADDRTATLLVEELNLSFPLHGGAERSPRFADLCSRGRHSGVELVGVSQAPQEVSMRFRLNCTSQVSFPLGAQKHWRAMAEAMSASGGSVSADQIGALAVHEFWRVDSGGKVMRGRNSLK